jgi:hypothetical protein
LLIYTGIGLVFAWRLLAKATLLTILPPIFRASSRIFEFNLPTRKHYTAATDYAQVPATSIRAVPSFSDLGLGRETPGSSSVGTPEVESPVESSGLHMNGFKGKSKGSSSSLEVWAAETRLRKSVKETGLIEKVKPEKKNSKRRSGSRHYDAEGVCDGYIPEMRKANVGWTRSLDQIWSLYWYWAFGDDSSSLAISTDRGYCVWVT